MRRIIRTQTDNLMSKIMKIGGIAVIVLAAITMAAGPIVRYIAVNQSEKLLGRRLEIGSVWLNIYDGHIWINDAVLYEQDGTTPFASFESLYLNASMTALTQKRVLVESSKLYHFKAVVEQNQEEFNFSDILERFSSDSDSTTTGTDEPSEWKIRLEKLGIEHGALEYRDMTNNGRWTIDNLSLVIPVLDLSDSKSLMDFDLNLNEGAQLRVSLKYDMSKMTYNIKFGLERFSLDGCLPYIQQYADIQELNGRLNAEFDIKGRIDHLLMANVTGKIGISGVSLVDDDDNTPLSIDSISVDIKGLHPYSRVASINSIYASGVKANYIIFEDTTTNISRLLKPKESGNSDEADTTATESEEPTPAWNIKIARTRISNVNFSYTDHTMPDKFEYTLGSMSLSMDGFDSFARNSAVAYATLQNKGTVHINWSGYVNGRHDQHFSLVMNNVELKSFTPFTKQYTAYPIEGGRLGLNTTINVVNGDIKGIATLNVYRPIIGKKDKKIDPQYDIPLKTVVKLLTDANNQLELKLPLEGNVQEPTFAMRKVISKALVGVLGRVMTAPFGGLSKRSENSDMSVIELSPLEGLGMSQYSKIDRIAELMNTMPGIRINFIQTIDYTNAQYEACAMEARKDYYQSQHPDADLSDGVIREEYQKVNITSSKVKSFINSRLKERNLSTKGTSKTELIRLYGEQADKELTASMERRDNQLSEYLGRLGLTDDDYAITSISIDSIRSNTKEKFKNIYSVTLDINQEEEESNE